MSQTQPVIRHHQIYEEGWSDEIHGRVRWRTLFSANQTPTESLTAGVAEILPGDQLKLHRHAPPELYYLLEGQGVVTINDIEHDVCADSAVFIPGNALHGIRNTGQTPLRFFYAFAMDSFEEVEYVF
jgi:mannose-6-phosphate isomerase-like protein (cupin superfamily)